MLGVNALVLDFEQIVQILDKLGRKFWDSFLPQFACRVRSSSLVLQGSFVRPLVADFNKYYPIRKCHKAFLSPGFKTPQRWRILALHIVAR